MVLNPSNDSMIIPDWNWINYVGILERISPAVGHLTSVRRPSDRFQTANGIRSNKPLLIKKISHTMSKTFGLKKKVKLKHGNSDHMSEVCNYLCTFRSSVGVEDQVCASLWTSLLSWGSLDSCWLSLPRACYRSGLEDHSPPCMHLRLSRPCTRHAVPLYRQTGCISRSVGLLPVE